MGKTKRDHVEIYDNICFVGRSSAAQETYARSSTELLLSAKTPQKPKSEKVAFKFGKIRVQVSSAKRVKVSQDGDALVISLSEG